MIASARSFCHLPPLTIVTCERPVSANLLKPVRAGHVVDLTRHHVYITGARQPVQIITIERYSCFASQGYTARVWLPNQRQYRTLPLPGNVALHFQSK